MVYRQNPDLLLRMFNVLLTKGLVPSSWKVATFVLISKAKGEQRVANVQDNSPMCKLDTAGKLLERLIKTILQITIQGIGNPSPRYNTVLDQGDQQPMQS